MTGKAAENQDDIILTGKDAKDFIRDMREYGNGEPTLEFRGQAIKPPLGEIILLHQMATAGDKKCMFCGKPLKYWGAMEWCDARLKATNRM